MQAVSTQPEQISDSNWRGKVFLWQEQALFLGQAADTSLHMSPAIKICIALDGQFKLRTTTGGPWKNFTSAIIAPGQIHAIDAQKNKLAMLVLVPEAEMAQPLAPIFSNQGLSVISPEVVRNLFPLFDDFDELHGIDVNAERVCATMVDKIKNGRLADLVEGQAIDPRVSQSVEWLRAEQEKHLSIKEIAANVKLSESRFSHLFSEQIKIPVRRYLLWLRLRDAIHLLAAGVPLTDTAHEAGFADSAHLTRTFRAMLGITPSSLIRHSSLISSGQ